MATYSEEFLNALSRASSSVGSLMDTLKEPDWKEKAEFQQNLDMEKLVKGSELKQDEALFQQDLNIESAHLAQALGKDMSIFDQDLSIEMSALKQVQQIQLAEVGARIAMKQINEETKAKYLDLGYEVGEDVDFGSVSQPKDGWLGSAFWWDGLLPGLPGNQATSAVDSGWGEGGQSAIDAMGTFKGVMALYNMQVPNALRASTIDPNAASVQEAIVDAEQGMNQALTLMEWSEDEGYTDDADYYASAYSSLQRQHNALKGNK